MTVSASTNQQPWLSIVGIGDDGLTDIGQHAHDLIKNAEIIIGGARHLALLPKDNPAYQQRLTWPSPLMAFIDDIIQRRGQKICILASGDPMHYGIGATLAKRIPSAEMMIIPAPSAFSLACARLGWNRHEVDTLTLHGRPLESLHRFIQPKAKILLLSHDQTTPAKVAQLLCERDYGVSRVIVLEHIAGEKERITECLASDWQDWAIADLNTIAIDCVASSQASLLPTSPGLPDNAYQHDGQLSKREVRAATLALLAPTPQQTLWDVGTGCGSIAIEWLRAAPRSQVFAIEKNKQRIELAKTNAQTLGTPQLKLIHGEAPAALVDLPTPDAIFIGGGISSTDLLQSCWSALTTGGRLVANAVTVNSEAVLLRWQQQHGGDLTRIAVSRAEPLKPNSPDNPLYAWRPLMPVTQYSITKVK